MCTHRVYIEDKQKHKNHKALINMQNFKNTNITGWTVSEKYDGVQGIWDGRCLKTRSGNQIAAPRWWTNHLPNKHLVGELWVARGCFDLARAIVCSSKADSRWKKIRFMVFSKTDGNLGPFAEKINQIKINSQVQLDNFYNQILAAGGEGVVLTSSDGEQYKKKPLHDDDGKLIGYKEGRGRNTGKIGAFVIELRDGRRFSVSSGITQKLRSVPPKIGSIIKFTFSGLTSSGLPRFASFAGLRAETNMEF
jgi:DNA ligase-1